MKSLHYHITHGNEQQKDEHEAISSYNSIETIIGTYTLQSRDTNNEYTPVFCTYAVTNLDIKEGKIRIPEEMSEFGKYAVLISDVKGFIESVKFHNPNMEIALVHYTDELAENITDSILYNPITWKSGKYKFQKELRFYEPYLSCCDDRCISEGYPGLITEDNITRYYTPSCTYIKLFATEELIRGIDVPREMLEAIKDDNLLASKFDLSTRDGCSANSVVERDFTSNKQIV